MSFIFGIVNLKGGAINPENVRKLGKTVQWDDFESKIEINSSYGWGYCWNKKRTPKAGIYTSERVAVLCDARIYNSEELKQSFEFEQPEEAFAKAYLKWGTGFVDKFDGDFSAVIIDFQQQKVLLVRDHIGVRPLTYSVKDDLLVFASHEFGIAKSQLVDNSLSEEKIIQSLKLQIKQKYYITDFIRIKKVIPGHITTISSNKIKSRKYWIPERIKTDKTLTFNMAVLMLRQQLTKSVQVRMESGFIGTHVSGGIDSSGVAAILADCIDDKNRLKGYSWSPESINGDVDGLNEKKLVDEFAEQKGIEVAYLSYKDSANIDDFILPEFEQMPIEIHTMRQACSDDISTLFSGWGGDEFVSLSLRGSINHIVFRLKLLTLFRWIKCWGSKATIVRARGEILPVLIPFGLLDSSGYKKNLNGLLKRSFIVKHFVQLYCRRRRCIYGFGNRKELMLSLLYNYHLPQRMDSWALYGEKFGIEYKFPLLDKKLLEFWFTVPVKYTYEGMCHRLLYRESMNGILTESIRKRVEKNEAVFQTKCIERDNMLKKILSTQPHLFSNIPDLWFLEGDNFFKLTSQQTSTKKEFIWGMYDIRFFLRYKSLVEKYLINDHIFMNNRKEK